MIALWGLGLACAPEPLRGGGVRARFDGPGVALSAGDGEEVVLRFVAWGRDGAMQPVPAVEPVEDPATGEVRYDQGRVLEWCRPRPCRRPCSPLPAGMRGRVEAAPRRGRAGGCRDARHGAGPPCAGAPPNAGA